MAVHDRIADVLLGSIVTLVSVPTGVGPAVGGWIAGRESSSAVRGATAGGLAGLLGGLPWAALVYLAGAGAIDPIGYHEGFVHLGVYPAEPGTFAVWQLFGLTGLVLASFVSFAVAGGLLGGLETDIVGELQDEIGSVREELSNGA